jgi:hypothetical protein
VAVEKAPAAAGVAGSFAPEAPGSAF